MVDLDAMSPALRRLRRSLAAVAVSTAFAGAAEAARRYPNVVILTVDTLRWDRLSSYGYHRPTSPAIDRLLKAGVRFTNARVPEPLTAPSMCSMVLSLPPHEHGSTRNGLGIRPGLPSLPGILSRRGYRTAGFVGNWTLRHKMSGLGEHFDDYHEIFSRKRWLGLFNAEATAEDLNDAALEWIEEHLDGPQVWPFLVWIHYVEPHAPYRLREEFAERLGLAGDGELPPEDRYDTEIAFVDRSIGRLLDELRPLSPPEDTLVVFLADHGESLGEHDYWGHGRHLYDVTLKVPMGLAWEGTIEPQLADAPASGLDVAPTVLGLVGLPVPGTFRGHDWSGHLRGEAEAPYGRVTYHQAHKGAVRGPKPVIHPRRNGLLEVGLVDGTAKEIVAVKAGRRWLFDLAADPEEVASSVPLASDGSERLDRWIERVDAGLRASDELPPPSLDEESLEQLRALGYID